MSKYILHDTNYDSFEVFDKEPTGEDIEEFLGHYSDDPSYVEVYEVKKVGIVKRYLSIVFDDKCKDC